MNYDILNKDDYFDLLPDDVLDIIFDYINPKCKIFLNKEYYNKYHYLVKSMVKKEDYLNYVKDIIKNNYTFVFKKILEEEFFNFKKEKIIVKNKRYKSLLHYFHNFCILTKSIDCRKLIEEKMDLPFKYIKKTSVRNIKWIH
jgi:hypothetical protein